MTIMAERRTKTTQELQADRSRRALLEFPHYTFRIMDLGGQCVFNVRTPGNRAGYATTPDSCSCEDQLRHPELVCKHREGLALYFAQVDELFDQPAPPLAAAGTPAPAAAPGPGPRRTADVNRDFPEWEL